jgi:hypothetical protein
MMKKDPYILNVIDDLLGILAFKDNCSANDEEAMKTLIYFCDSINSFFQDLCKSETTTSIKILTDKHSEGILTTLCRDTFHKPYRIDDEIPIKENSIFLRLLSSLTLSKKSYYLRNSVKNYVFHNTKPKFESLLIAPIKDYRSKEKNTILGFLNIECKKANKFKEKLHPVLLNICNYFIYKTLNNLIIENPRSIENMIEKENQKPKIFVSHSSADKLFVNKLRIDLEENGFSVWFDELDLNIGDVLSDEISKGIHNSHCFLIVLSPNSINSKWVNYELNEAYAIHITGNKKIIPIIIDDLKKEDIPLRLKKHLYCNFSTNYSQAFLKLTKSLKEVKNTIEKS